MQDNRDSGGCGCRDVTERGRAISRGKRLLVVCRSGCPLLRFFNEIGSGGDWKTGGVPVDWVGGCLLLLYELGSAVLTTESFGCR